MKTIPKILDVGCRYGVYDQFKKSINDCLFFMVDADKQVLNRLKKKYKNLKNFKFFPDCLGEKNSIVSFKIFNHKGYSSTKRLNKKTLWFKQKNEKKIFQIKEYKIKQIKSKDFIEREKFLPDIIKVDIEGGDLNFLRGLENKINKIKFFILETPFENNFESNSDFGSIHKFMLENNFILIKMTNVKNLNLNIFSNLNDQIPGVADSFYMNSTTLKPLSNENYNLILSLFLILDHDQLLFQMLMKFKNKFKISRKNIFYGKLKKKIASKLVQKAKESFYSYSKANKLFKSLYGEKLPHLSDFNESDFYNPI